MTDETTNFGGIFRRSTMNRVSSSEELDHYIKVTNPSAWIVIIAALLLVGGILVWAIFATVPITVKTTGIVPIENNQDDAKVFCFVNESTYKRMQGTDVKASIEGVEAESVQIVETPLSASEVVSLLGSDFYTDSIKLDDWNYMIVIKPAVELNHTDFEIEARGFQAHLVPVSIDITETQPINIVLGHKG